MHTTLDDFFALHVSVTCYIKHKVSRIDIQIYLLVSLVPAERGRSRRWLASCATP